MCYYMAMTLAFFGITFYAVATRSSHGADCVAGCAAQIMTPTHLCPAGGTLLENYDARCVECTASDAITWPCPEETGIQLCQGGGKTLGALDCASTLDDTDLEGMTGVGATCVIYTATDVLADGSQAPGDSKYNLTFADLEEGPAIQVFTNTPEAGATLKRSAACADPVAAMGDLHSFGRICYDVPSRVSLRGLLVPGLIVFILTYFVQALFAMAACMCMCCFRRTRGEAWVRLSKLSRILAGCFICMPPCIRFLNYVTGVVLVASLVFLNGMEVCREAQNDAGVFAFYGATSTLMTVALGVFICTCVGGGVARTNLHREAAFHQPAKGLGDDSGGTLTKMLRNLGP